MTLRPSGAGCVASAVTGSPFISRGLARLAGLLHPPSAGRRPRDVPSLEPPEARRRLFTALAWSAGAFAVIGAVSPTAASAAPILEPSLPGAVLCVALATLGFVEVSRVARRLDARDGTRAHVLLWATTLAYAGLASGLAGALGVAPDAQAEVVPQAVLNVAGSAVAALVIAVAIPVRALRGLVLSLIVLGPFLVLAPELLWLGVVCAVLLVLAVEAALHHALAMRDVPEPALAACLVAAVGALPVAAVWLSVRFLLRAIVVAGAARS